MIRLLTVADATSLRDIRLLSLQTDPNSFASTFDFERHFSTEHFKSRITSSTNYPFGFWGYFKGKSLIGYAQLSQEALPKKQHIAWLYELYVIPEYRGRTIAKQILQHLLLEFQKTNLFFLFLSVNTSNVLAIKLYEKLDFKLEHIFENHIKSDRFEDEQVMVFSKKISKSQLQK